MRLSYQPLLIDYNSFFPMHGGADIAEQQRRRRFLADATAALTSSLDYHETLTRVANLAVPLFADSCAIHLIEEDEEIRLVAAAHVNPEKADAMLVLSGHERISPSRAWARAIRESRSLLIANIDAAVVRETLRDDPVLLGAYEQLQFTSQLSVPLRAHDRTLGGITLALGPGERRYAGEDLAVAEDLARIASIGVENSLLYRDAQRQQAEAASARDRAAFLAEVSAVVSSSLDLMATIRAATRLAVPALADFCEVRFGFEEKIRVAAAAHADPAKERILEEAGQRYEIVLSRSPGIATALTENRPVLVPDLNLDALTAKAPDEFALEVVRTLRPRSGLVVPLSARGHALGVISLFMSDSSRRFTEADVPIAAEFGRRVGIAIDNARLYEQAQESNRLKDEFLSVLSHELRTPLNAVLGWSRMLASGQLDESTRTKAAQSIHRNAQAQMRLVEDILDAARGLAGKLHVECEPVNVVEIVDAVVQASAPQAAARQVILTRRPGARSILVSADPVRLRQIVGNLLSNAIKFTPPDGRVDVSVELAGGGIDIRVRDDGIGIEPAFLPYVFERFRQADASVTRKYGGLGLGLAIVRQLVELHGGSVSAESDGPGHGATFIVSLPVLETGTLRPAPEPDEPVPSLAGIKVLVIDDNADALEITTAMLERTGASVQVAASAREGDDWLARRRFDVLLVDLAMPAEDGFSFIRRLRRQEDPLRRVCAIAVSAYADEESRNGSDLAGFDAHVTKPVDADLLVRTIVAVLSHDTT